MNFQEAFTPEERAAMARTDAAARLAAREMGLEEPADIFEQPHRIEEFFSLALWKHDELDHRRTA